MLMRQDYMGLAEQFGYALAFGREPAVAIETDFLRMVALQHDLVSGANSSIVVKYFATNDTGLFAVVECTIPVANRASILLELIVSGTGEEKYITLEDISRVGE